MFLFLMIELFGTVQDPAGLGVSAAKVRAVEQSTGASFQVESRQAGEYRLLGLPTGQFVLTVEKPGFRTYRRNGVTLGLGERIELNIGLELGQSAEAVEVTAAAPLLRTDGGDVSFNLDQRKIASLPLDGRNFVPLIALSPGVALPGGGSLLPRINGSRPRTNEYIYDGVSASQPEPGQVAFYPIIDAIAEFRVNINSYSPEYGRSNGGAVIVSMKSGGNDLRGTLFEFIRNEDLNARNYFAQPGAKPEFRRNQYGLVLGGPLQKNKTFFFVDWQGTRLRTGLTRFSTVPTLAQRQGIFANTTIPPSRFDPIGLHVLQQYPLPNLPGAANNYVRTGVEPDNQDQFDTRVDRYFGEKHRVFARYSYLRDDDTPVTPLPDGSGAISSGVIAHTITRGDQLVASYDWSLSASKLNQATFGYTRRNSNSSALTSPTYAIAGFQQIGPTSGANGKSTTSVTEYLDTFSIIKGRHTIKFGTDIRREALDVFQPSNPAGLFTITAASTNNAVASLLLGQVNTYSIDIQNRQLRERAHIAEFFVNDDLRLSDRLILNIGTRYTLNFPSTEVNNQGAVFNLKTQVLDFPHTARELECCNFGPRVGIAFRAAESLVFRSGYGMVWFEQTGITTPFTLPQFPFVQTLLQQSFTLANGPTVQPATPNPNSGLGQGVFGVDRNSGSGYSQQWNFTVQKTFGKNLNFEVGYLGSKNTRLGVPDANLNQLPPAYLSLGPALLAVQQSLRPYPKFTTVALFRDNVGNSKYNALQAKLEKRFSKGLTFTFAYTFSKLIDDASSVFSQTIFTGPILNTGVADAYNRRLERDLSNGDIPRVFSTGWVSEIPRWWKFSGWRIGGLMRVQAGDTVAVSQATNFNSAFGFGVQRPNRIANPNIYESRSAARWFNTAAFTQAPQFTIGNSSRNPVRGPGLQQADLMIAKTFRITERLNIEFRAEAFNVSNTPPLNDPNGSFGSAAFGSIISAGNPRVFEFAGKVHF